MSHSLLEIRALAGAVAILVLVAKPVGAGEPRTVSAEGVVDLEGSRAGAGRGLALRAALMEAVMAVARDFVGPERLEAEEQRIREALEPRADEYVITYRVDGSSGPVPSADDSSREVFSVRLTATVDAALVRKSLEPLMPLEGSGERPSVLLRAVRLDTGSGGPRTSLGGFRDFLARRLRDAGMVVVEPALRVGAPVPSGEILDLARGLGADLGVEVRVGWQPGVLREGLAGGVAEVRVRAVRVRDGSDIALSHFQGPGYHEDPDEAFARALEAVEGQVAENLVLQLGRNWKVLARKDGPVELRLLDVTRLLEVYAVRRTLENLLGAQEVSLVMLAPGVAELRVRGPFSPGALQDRLAAVAFDGFRLRPVGVSRQQVELRLEQRPETDAGLDPGDAPGAGSP